MATLAVAGLLAVIAGYGWWQYSSTTRSEEVSALEEEVVGQPLQALTNSASTAVEPQRTSGPQAVLDEPGINRAGIEQTGLDQPASELGELPASEQAENAFTRLLSYWSIDQSASREDDLCAIAADQGMQCFAAEDMTVAELAAAHSAGLVRLQEQDDRVAIYFYEPAEEGFSRLANASGELLIEDIKFANLWDGTFLYLWQPPQGYQGPLRIGTKNAQVVDWVQQQILRWDPDYEQVITGGVYSSAIGEQVKRFQTATGLAPDGILGRETVMALNRLADSAVELEAEL